MGEQSSKIRFNQEHVEQFSLSANHRKDTSEDSHTLWGFRNVNYQNSLGSSSAWTLFKFREKRKTDHKDAKKESTEVNGGIEKKSVVGAEGNEVQMTPSPKKSDPGSSDSGLIVDLSPSNTTSEDVIPRKEPLSSVSSKYQSNTFFKPSLKVSV